MRAMLGEEVTKCAVLRCSIPCCCCCCCGRYHRCTCLTPPGGPSPAITTTTTTTHSPTSTGLGPSHTRHAHKLGVVHHWRRQGHATVHSTAPHGSPPTPCSSRRCSHGPACICSRCIVRLNGSLLLRHGMRVHVPGGGAASSATRPPAHSKVPASPGATVPAAPHPLR